MGYASSSVRVPITTGCFAVVVGVAAHTPHVADWISIIGAFLSSPLMFLFPAMMYRKILGRQDVVLPWMLGLLTVALIQLEVIIIIVDIIRGGLTEEILEEEEFH